jgi:hypothetical protein
MQGEQLATPQGKVRRKQKQCKASSKHNKQKQFF